jgi:hypothetical protein
MDTRVTILYEGYKLMMPLSSMKAHKFVNGRVPPYIIDKSCPTKVKWIITEMTGAKIFEQLPVKKPKKEKVDATQCQDDTGNFPAPKAKGRGKAKAKAKAKPAEMLEDMCPVISDPALKDASRPKYFIEDLTCALDVAYAALPFGVDKQQLANSKTLLISLGLEFCWAGSVQIDGVTLVDYSAVRKKLQEKVHQYCTAPCLAHSCNTMFANSRLLKLARRRCLFCGRATMHALLPCLQISHTTRPGGWGAPPF